MNKLLMNQYYRKIFLFSIILFLGLTTFNSYGSSRKYILFKSGIPVKDVKFIDNNGEELIASTSESRKIRDIHYGKWFSPEMDTYTVYYFITFKTSKNVKWVKIFNDDFTIELFDLDKKNKYEEVRGKDSWALHKWISVYYSEKTAKTGEHLRYNPYTQEYQSVKLPKPIPNVTNLITNGGKSVLMKDARIVTDFQGLDLKGYYRTKMSVRTSDSSSKEVFLEDIKWIKLKSRRHTTNFHYSTCDIKLKNGNLVSGEIMILSIEGIDPSDGLKIHWGASDISMIIFPIN